MVFRTSFSNFYYKVMPFGLKIVKATYQRVVRIIFYDMTHDWIEDYVDGLVVKFKKTEAHLEHLRNVFKRS